MSENDNNVKVREYINPAVYIETVYDMSACNKTTPIYMNIPGSGDHPKILKVKRCVCFTNPKDCPCHPYKEEDDIIDSTIRSNLYPRKCFTSSTTALLNKPTSYAPIKSHRDSPTFESDSGITVRATNSTTDDLHLSIPSLTSLSTVRIMDEQTREDNFRNWCMRKDHERKLQEHKNLLLDEIKKKQREQQVAFERENFKRWLANKKLEEETKRRESERKRREERIEQELREKRNQENELKFQLWVKRKEEVMLDKKIKDQLRIMRNEEEKQRRLAYSAKAYEIWLQQSKNKPKPIPLNRGLESLKSSVSVTYINPQPWVPNIETQKPTSQ